MAKTEPELHHEQPRSSFGTWIGVVLLFALFGLLVWAVMGAMPRSDSYEAKRGQARAEKLKVASEEAQKATESYGWVDKEKGVVRLPVRRAMELSVGELAQRKPAPAGPISPGADQPGMQVTAPLAPAPGAAPQATTSPSPVQTAISGEGSSIRGQPAAAANPAGAPPGTQPGPNASPPGPPSSTTREFQPEGLPERVQSPPGPPLPVPGTTPGATPPPGAKVSPTPGAKP